MGINLHVCAGGRQMILSPSRRGPCGRLDVRLGPVLSSASSRTRKRKEARPMKILGKDCEVHPDVPEPLPFKKFMVYIGPAMMSIALGLGTSEPLLSPRLTAEFGTGWVGMMVLSPVFPP